MHIVIPIVSIVSISIVIIIIIIIIISSSIIIIVIIVIIMLFSAPFPVRGPECGTSMIYPLVAAHPWDHSAPGPIVIVSNAPFH